MAPNANKIADLYRGAAKSAETLHGAYQSCPLRGDVSRPAEELPEAGRESLDVLRAEFAAASEEVLRGFHALIFCNPMPGDLPLAVNGVALQVPAPSAKECLVRLVSVESWAGMATDDEAEDYIVEIHQALLRAVHLLREHGYPDDVIDEFQAQAASLPGLADLVALDRLEGPADAHNVMMRVAQDVAAGTAGALTAGLARAAAARAEGQIYAQMRPDQIKDLRAAAGWTQTQLAEAIGLSQRHLARLEAGETNVGEALGRRIAQACVAQARARRAAEAA